ncbi:MAG: nucleotide exchange factor GrpE [Candidatus Paceibacterota bacterium]
MKKEDNTNYEENEDLVFDNDQEGESKLDKKLKKTKKKLKECEGEKAKYLDELYRAKSDLINFRKRMESKAEENKRLSEKSFAQKLLPVLDSFSMAVTDQENWEELPEEWRKGMENVHNQLLKVLRDYGVSSFSPKGEHFEPSFHEAVAVVDVEEPDQDNIITEVIQDGYVMDEEVLRCAKVKVGHYNPEEEQNELTED